MSATMTWLARTGNVLTKAAFVNLLSPQLVDDTLPIEQVRGLFARFVDQVEIENHNFCNRVCWFCPNSFIDRRSQLRLMKDSVFKKIIEALAEIDYDGNLTWSRYHEALADHSVFNRIAAARQALPRATLVVISNGDYMDRSTLPQLESAGVDRLILDLYLPDGKERDPEARARGLRQFRRRTGLNLEPSSKVGYVITGTRLKGTLEIPRATLVVISNGDYMDRSTLPQLESAGVDRLILDLYLPDGKERDPEARARGLRQFRRRTGLNLEPSSKVGYVITGTRLKGTLEIPCYTKEGISTRSRLRITISVIASAGFAPTASSTVEVNCG